MDDQEKHKKNHKKSPSPVHKKKETKVDIEKKTGVEKNNEAGPSRLDDLPGSISTPRTLRSGLSKSEHNIPRIITRQDVANALKLSSTSFLKPDPHISNLNLKDLKIPIPLEKRDEKVDPATMMDLRKFMASCFKFTKEAPNTTLPDVPMRVLSSFVPVLPNAASTSCAQTDECHVVGLKTNEVIVTSPPVSNLANIIETKAAKDAKNKSDTLSNKSELGLANRDSMTSIGSNVCRICMTRGRERLISPCNCKGSLANVHLSCLERWLNQVGRNHCELCGFR
ncbi:hypothetical protein O0L34_g1726 [Tuta absoluta]|nr:hypothetical protein O0L34_g1726 [Tuta absoluta]